MCGICLDPNCPSRCGQFVEVYSVHISCFVIVLGHSRQKIVASSANFENLIF